jgi:oxygen-independent coproporphyrinogen III oxidase
VWDREQLNEIAAGIDPKRHSFTYTYPPPRYALARSSRGGLSDENFSAWTDASIYLHVPFCRMNCNFCSLHRKLIRSDDEVRLYFAALKRELGAFDSIGAQMPLAGVYIGGGTPTILGSDRLGELLDRVAEVYNINPTNCGVETTLECAPDESYNFAKWNSFLSALANRTRLPLTRVSIGVQAWDIDVLGRMGRTGAKTAPIELIKAADQVIGIYNIDFILGYPYYESPAEEAKQILDGVRELRSYGFAVPSVSIYQLWDNEKVPATRSRLDQLSSSDELIKALWVIQYSLFEMGYSPGAGTTFISDPKFLHRWTVHRCAEFRHIGYGSGSYSFLPNGFVQRQRNIKQYVTAISHDARSAESIDRSLNAVFRLSAEDSVIRRIIVGLRSGGSVKQDVSTLSTQSPNLAELGSKIQRLLELELLTYREGRISLDRKAFALTNAISAYLHPSTVPRKMLLK